MTSFRKLKKTTKVKTTKAKRGLYLVISDQLILHRVEALERRQVRVELLGAVRIERHRIGGDDIHEKHTFKHGVRQMGTDGMKRLICIYLYIYRE